MKKVMFMNNNELAKEFLVKFGISIFSLTRALGTVYIIVILFPLLNKNICICLILLLILFDIICRIAFSGKQNDDEAISNLIAYNVTTCFFTVMCFYAIKYIAQYVMPTL